MISVEMYKIVNSLAPDILSNLLPINDNMRELRSKIKSVYNG